MGTTRSCRCTTRRTTPGGYDVRQTWRAAITDPGAGQVRHLKNLLLSRPYWDRVPDQSLLAGAEGERYERVLVTRGKDYALAYTYTGRSFSLRLDAISGDQKVAWWYRPADGSARWIGVFPGDDVRQWHPPGDATAGNDWVLVLDDETKAFPAPGTTD